MFMKTFGTELRQKRRTAGYTQRELGAIIGVHQTTVKNWELDEAEPRIESYRKLVEVLGEFDSVKTSQHHDLIEQLNTTVRNERIVSEQETEQITKVECETEQDTLEVDTGITLVEFINDFNRMCESHNTCENCPFRTVRILNKTCFESVKHNPTKAAQVINLWVLDNPVKTRLEYVKECLPHIKLQANGTPRDCRCVNDLFGDIETNCNLKCKKCWDKPLNYRYCK